MRPVALGAVLGLLGAGALAAQTPSETAMLKQVDEHYNHLVSLRTQFTEHYTGLGMDRTESGVLMLKKPGRMRWEYDRPEGKLFVLDGKYAWSYTPGDAQVQRMPAKQVDDLRSPLRFLLGHTQLRRELDGISVISEQDGYRISGVPKGMGQRVRQLALKIARGGRITQIRLEETDGATTEFDFDRSEENVALPDSGFWYTPPPGIGVADALPPV